MLGLDDFSIFLAYLLSVFSVVLCVVYGIWNWNRGLEAESAEAAEEAVWESEERQIDDTL